MSVKSTGETTITTNVGIGMTMFPVFIHYKEDSETLKNILYDINDSCCWEKLP